MTLDMLEILIDALVKALETMSEANHWMGLLFIACVLGIGTWWALSILVKDFFLKGFKI